MGGGLDFLENSLIWVSHNKMLLVVKNFKKGNLKAFLKMEANSLFTTVIVIGIIFIVIILFGQI